MIISKTRQKRLAEQKEVKELLAVLKENNFSSAKDLMAAIGHVSDLEEQLSNAVQELTSMRKELQEMKQSPLKSRPAKVGSDLGGEGFPVKGAD